jgi:23S rRNA (cytidine1920-2'-O)/16S rRNA (cytidine1409-2'-O)-methyltransferase
MRLDQRVFELGLAPTRSQAESWIRLGQVTVDGEVAKKTGQQVHEKAKIKLTALEMFVSRAGLKLASANATFQLDFTDKVMLDVGSSTGGFTDYALQHGAKKVYAVDVGSEQLAVKLRADSRVELHERTDIRRVFAKKEEDIITGSRLGGRDDNTGAGMTLIEAPEIITIDVSFMSLREILPHLKANCCKKGTLIVAMAKPQFESGDDYKHKGVIKNEKMRRTILEDLEKFIKKDFVIKAKTDSKVAGEKGNVERFYLLSATR